MSSIPSEHNDIRQESKQEEKTNMIQKTQSSSPNQNVSFNPSDFLRQFQQISYYPTSTSSSPMLSTIPPQPIRSWTPSTVSETDADEFSESKNVPFQLLLNIDTNPSLDEKGDEFNEQISVDVGQLHQKIMINPLSWEPLFPSDYRQPTVNYPSDEHNRSTQAKGESAYKLPTQMTLPTTLKESQYGDFELQPPVRRIRKKARAFFNPESKARRGHLKRPINGFIAFTMLRREQIAKENPTLTNREVIRKLSQIWKESTPQEKHDYETQAYEMNHDRAMAWTSSSYSHTDSTTENSDQVDMEKLIERSKQEEKSEEAEFKSQ
eukprot:TRINITY_DN2334_c0_g1_i2.p1 TRINITY_DN2334_c0_g1~~TRINITY_DN2334_c0_g1_i2.p1  ORF type:complete len:322 (+),score=70.07 TRINITY_DN2334_c0_g1_i2:78-1043(+)